MYSKAQQAEAVLKEINASSSEILGSALVSNDGLPIVTVLRENVESHRVGGMTAALLALSSRATKELHCGNMNQVIVRGDDGYIVLMQAGKDMVLVITAKECVTLGLVLYQARNALNSLPIDR